MITKQKLCTIFHVDEKAARWCIISEKMGIKPADYRVGLQLSTGEFIDIQQGRIGYPIKVSEMSLQTLPAVRDYKTKGAIRLQGEDFSLSLHNSVIRKVYAERWKGKL